MDPFARVPIGETGVEVTRLGLGCAPLSGMIEADGLYGGVAREEALDIVSAALEAGVRYFDTAPFYGNGVSEARLGTALAGKDRGSLTISTKAGRVLNPTGNGPIEPDGLPELEPVFDMTRDGIRRSLEESLQRLGIDRVDILYLHDPDMGGLEKESVETALPALVELREEGVVKAIGCGMNEWQMPTRFIRRFDLDVVLLAGRYTLLDHSAHPEFMPLCIERGVKVAIGGPYNSGILARDLDGPVSFDYLPAPEHLVQRARRLKTACERHGVDLRAAALQFVLAHPAVAAAIPGASNVSELLQNVELVRAPIPSELWEDLRVEGLIPADAPVPNA